MNRRRVLAALGGTALVGGGGTAYLAREALTDLEASPVGVDPDAQSATGYEETGVESVVVEEPLPAGLGTVVVTNYMTEHEKSVDIEPLGSQRAAIFVTLSTPQVRLAGKEFNPVEGMSTDELVTLVQDNYDGIENVARDEDGTVTILGQSTAYTRYTADATFDGVAVPVDLYVTAAVETDSDLAIAVGAYPRDLRPIEESNVVALLEAVVDDAPGSYDGGDGEGENGGPEDGGDDADGDGDTGGDDGEGSDSDEDGGFLPGVGGDDGLLG